MPLKAGGFDFSESHPDIIQLLVHKKVRRRTLLSIGENGRLSMLQAVGVDKHLYVTPNICDRQHVILFA